MIPSRNWATELVQTAFLIYIKMNKLTLRLSLKNVTDQDKNSFFSKKNPSFLFWKFHSPETPTTLLYTEEKCFCYQNICFIQNTTCAILVIIIIIIKRQ